MNVLYIAYSCAPNAGSEDKIGWRIPLESAKTNKVFVITKAEHRPVIAEYLKNHEIANVEFYYVDIPDIYKKIFKGGFYSGRLNIWHRRAFPVAEKLCREEKIDLIHQITPVEFRSIGAYAKIKGVKFVCGPLGGAETAPVGLRGYMRAYPAEKIRWLINCWYRFQYRIKRTLRRCDYVMFSNHETSAFLGMGASGCEILSEIAIDIPEEMPAGSKIDNRCTFLVAGRLIYRKGHGLLLDALERIPRELEYTCRIVGTGPELDALKKRVEAGPLADHVVFTGKIPYTEMIREYANADVFIMPSLRETSGSVLLEAMAAGLPVVTIRRFGGAVLLDNEAGWLYDGATKEDYIQNLKQILTLCITDPQQVQCKAAKAKEIAAKNSWETKMKRYNGIYRSLSSISEA